MKSWLISVVYKDGTFQRYKGTFKDFADVYAQIIKDVPSVDKIACLGVREEVPVSSHTSNVVHVDFRRKQRVA
jgi:hypothetical protein